MYQTKEECGTKSMVALSRDFEAFHSDPLGCDESIVVGIKDGVKESWWSDLMLGGERVSSAEDEGRAVGS